MPTLTIPAITYRIRYIDLLGHTVVVNIDDMSSFVAHQADVNIISLTGGETPFQLDIIDKNEDKYTPIRAKQATIRFISTSSVSINTFSTGADNRFHVFAYIETSTFPFSSGDAIFNGYLVMDDHSQPFLPNPQEVQLTATDGLGTLREIKLTDENSKNPRGIFKIIQYIAWCLQNTDLKLNINVASTWYEQDYADLPAWEHVYLYAKTFEASINVSEDCYTVLSKILGHGWFLTQWKGEWWIGNIDEMDSEIRRSFQFDYLGNYIAPNSNFSSFQNIGRGQNLYFTQEDQILKLTRPHKYVKLTYQLQYPQEIVDNIDFARGDQFISPVSPDISLYISVYANLAAFPATGDTELTYKANDTGKYYKWTGVDYSEITVAEIPLAGAYVWEDWTVGRYLATDMAGTSSAIGAYIVKVLQLGNEKAHYGVVGYSTESAPLTWIRSNPIAVHKYDKCTVSVDFRFNKTTVGDHVNLLAIVLEGDDGLNYVWSAGPKVWNPATIFPAGATFANTYDYAPGDSKTNWATTAADVNPMPRSGNLYILLSAGYNFAGTGNPEVHYSNLQFTYIPFTNGSYQKYTARSRKVEQVGTYKANVDDQIYLSDGIKKLGKGAMFKLVGGAYVFTENWYNGGALANQGITAPVPSSYLAPFGHMQVYALWNQVNREMNIFDGTVKGLGDDRADLINTYQLTAITVNTINKQFIITGYQRDYRMDEGKVLLMEVNDTLLGRDYLTPETVKYE